MSRFCASCQGKTFCVCKKCRICTDSIDSFCCSLYIIDTGGAEGRWPVPIVAPPCEIGRPNTKHIIYEFGVRTVCASPCFMDWQSVLHRNGSIDGSRGNRIGKKASEVAPIRRRSGWGLKLFWGAHGGAWRGSFPARWIVPTAESVLLPYSAFRQRPRPTDCAHSGPDTAACQEDKRENCPEKAETSKIM